ncbi:unnamed protein product [Spodoptera exigua]|nr:unnamed protein product [Spodoptera exigua]
MEIPKNKNQNKNPPNGEEDASEVSSLANITEALDASYARASSRKESDSESDSSLSGVSIALRHKKDRGVFKRPRLEPSSNEQEAPAPKIPTAARGRGKGKGSTRAAGSRSEPAERLAAEGSALGKAAPSDSSEMEASGGPSVRRVAFRARLKEPIDHHRRGPKGLMFSRGCGVSAIRYRDLGTEQEKEQGGRHAHNTFAVRDQREASDAERLTIQAATQTASGRYTCEVSADAPSFQTAQVHTHMYVVVLPKSGPSMHGLKRRYRPGMKLKVECISRHSLPAANLSFFINNDAVGKRADGLPDGKQSAPPLDTRNGGVTSALPTF